METKLPLPALFDRAPRSFLYRFYTGVRRSSLVVRGAVRDKANIPAGARILTAVANARCCARTMTSALLFPSVACPAQTGPLPTI